ncbi:MAG: CHRD domain-containing protein [Gemmatimonadota bacterium]
MLLRHSFIVILAVGLVLAGCDGPVPDTLQPPSPDEQVEEAAFSHRGQDQALQPRNFVAPLEGAQEVEPVDTRARGLARFQLSRDGSSISYRLNVANIENVLMAHIHVAPTGENGGVVVWLYPDAPPPTLIEGRFQGTLATGTITMDDLVGSLAGATLDDLIDLIVAGDTYVNVHTTQNRGGEIRGQIQVAGAR